jgi:hypothetical protein
MGSGLDSSVGFAEETTWGTAVTPTRFMPHVDFGLKFVPKPVQGEAIQAGMYGHQSALRANASSLVSGDINWDFSSKGFGLLLKHCTGAVATLQNGSTLAYTHTFTEGSSIAGKGLTFQAGIPRTNSTTIDPYTFSGCKITSWELSCAQGDLLKFKTSVVGKAVTTQTALASPSYLTGSNVFYFQQGALTVNGSPYVAMRDFTLTQDKQLTTDETQHFGSLGLIDEPQRKGFTDPKITGTCDYIDQTVTSAFTADSELAMVLTFGGAGLSKKIVTGPPDYYEQLVITLAGLRLNGDVPTISGPDLVTYGLDADVLIPAAGGTRLSIAYTTLDATP